MEEDIDFKYEKEFWYVSAFINSNQLDISEKIDEIRRCINEKVNNLTETDLRRIAWNKEWLNAVIELGKNLTIENITWVTFIESFPFHDENRNLAFNSLGYFEIEVEYYKDNPEKKANIKPVFIQQIPTVVSQVLKEMCDLKVHEYLNIDHESPIFIFATSNKLQGIERIDWTIENIQKYKKKIGMWTEIYSGSWSDYNDTLYDIRIQNNLSNRLSELHFIRRNSGFIYMEEENYRLFFNSYMREFVLTPTAQIRSLLYALISVNESLDILFTMQTADISMEVSILEGKLDNLKLLRGRIQTQLTILFNELDYNRRQHYTAVLSHLMDEFDIKGITQRINEKYDVIYDSVSMIYQKKSEKSQEIRIRGMNTLNILFGLGVIADLGQAAIALYQAYIVRDLFSASVSASVSLLISAVLLGALYYFGKERIAQTRKFYLRAVDAIVLDEQDNIILIRRRYSPFKGELAFPGGFIEEGEDPIKAVIREVKEEIGLDVRVENLVGVYDKEDRDPRGRVASTVFQCRVIGDLSNLKGGIEAEDIVIKPLDKLKGVDLAFDHEDMLKDAMGL